MDLIADGQAAQLDYVGGLFDDLLAWRARAAEGEDVAAMVERRLDKWVNGLSGWYNEWVLRGAVALDTAAKAEVTFEWELGESDHCDTCRWLAKQGPKPARWFLENGYIPRKPGANLECGGWQCQCVLVDVSGKPLTRRKPPPPPVMVPAEEILRERYGILIEYLPGAGEFSSLELLYLLQTISEFADFYFDGPQQFRDETDIIAFVRFAADGEKGAEYDPFSERIFIPSDFFTDPDNSAVEWNEKFEADVFSTDLQAQQYVIAHEVAHGRGSGFVRTRVWVALGYVDKRLLPDYSLLYFHDLMPHRRAAATVNPDMEKFYEGNLSVTRHFDNLDVHALGGYQKWVFEVYADTLALAVYAPDLLAVWQEEIVDDLERIYNDID